LCKKDDFLNTALNARPPVPKYDEFYENNHENESDMRINLSYCASCKIMFDVGCVHSEEGCTSRVYNGHLISKWQDKKEACPAIYTGMPQFDSTDEWFERANDIFVIDMVCINAASNIGYCNQSGHPEYKNRSKCNIAAQYPKNPISA
jgi:hypothetical protein